MAEVALLWQAVRPQVLDWWKRRGLWLAAVPLALILVEINLRWQYWLADVPDSQSLVLEAKALFLVRMFLLAAVSVLAAEQCEAALSKAIDAGQQLVITPRSRFLLYLTQLIIPCSVFYLGESVYFLAERYAKGTSSGLPLGGLDPHSVVYDLAWSLHTPADLVLSVIWIYGMLAIVPCSRLIAWTLPVASLVSRLLALALSTADLHHAARQPFPFNPGVLGMDLWTSITSLALLAACLESLRLQQRKIFNAAFGVLAVCALLIYPALEVALQTQSMAALTLVLLNSIATAVYGRFLLVDGLLKTKAGSALLPTTILELLGLIAVFAFIWWLLRPRDQAAEAENHSTA